MADGYYFELSADYFDRADIRLIEAMADGDRYILFHLKLLLSSCGNDGILAGGPNEIMDLVDEHDLKFVMDAVGLFEKYGLIEFWDSDVLCLTDYAYGFCRKRNYPRDRNTKEYKKWRAAVYQRDGYTCQKCGKTGCELAAHHIKPWAKFVDCRYDVSNGVTLCKNCHIKEHRRRA